MSLKGRKSGLVYKGVFFFNAYRNLQSQEGLWVTENSCSTHSICLLVPEPCQMCAAGGYSRV